MMLHESVGLADRLGLAAFLEVKPYYLDLEARRQAKRRVSASPGAWL